MHKSTRCAVVHSAATTVCFSLSSPGRLHVILFKSLSQICCAAKIPKQHDTHSVWLYKNEEPFLCTHTIGYKLECSYLGSGQAICLARTKTLICSWLLWFRERFPNSCFWWSNSEATFLYRVQQGKQSLGLVRVWSTSDSVKPDQTLKRLLKKEGEHFQNLENTPRGLAQRRPLGFFYSRMYINSKSL